MSRRSIWMLVLLSAPGGTLERLNTLLAKSASLATSNVYESARWPLVAAFWITRRIGCSFSLNLNPCAGSSNAGAVMFTPGIGPATVGAVGDELLDVWQAASAASSKAHENPAARDFMVDLVRPQQNRQAQGARERALTLPAYRPEPYLTLGSVEALGSR